jgi:hypothetical protein
MARQVGSGLEAARATLLRSLIPYVQNPFLALRTFGLWSLPSARIPRASHLTADTDNAYDENTYRLPIGITVLWIVLCFTLAVLYALGCQLMA